MMTELKIKAQYALDILKAGGADSAKATASRSEVREFNVDNGVFSLYRTLYGFSMGLTVLKEGKKGSASGNSPEEEDINALCGECLSVAEAGESDEAYTLAAENKQESFCSGVPECDEIRLFDRCKELLEDVKREFPLIVIEQLIVKHRRVQSVTADLSGTLYTETAGAYSLSLMYSAHEGDKTSSFFGSGVWTDSLERPFIELARIRAELGEVERQIETAPVEGKFVGTVICPPSALESLIYDALGNFAGGGAVLDRTTPWIDSLGKQVADSRLTVSSLPKGEGIVTGDNISGEGFINEDCTVIKDGVLQTFLLNRYLSKKTGFAHAGNLCGNYVVEAGEVPLADMIKGVKRGLWIGRLSGGSPASNGDFSAVAKNSFLIEDGRLCGAVSETMINGNLKDMLMDIGDISVEQVCDGNTVLPYISFKNITISGKN